MSAGVDQYGISSGGVTGLVEFLRDQRYSQLVILTDENANEHCLPIIEESASGLFADVNVLLVPEGEQSKSPQILASVWQSMMEHGLDRDALMLNLGGGVITDLGGFAASTYKRGIDFINIPTTLLGMVDAAVGGKTGINVAGFKNQAGNFSRPLGIFIDPQFLKTLPDRELMSGFAELFKHALLAGGDLFGQIAKSEACLRENITAEIIGRAANFKAETAERDYRETGIRRQLNLGHTIGHAVESGTMNTENEFKHGEAVAVGLAVEFFIAEKLVGLSRDFILDMLDLLVRWYPDPFKNVFDAEMISEFCKGDKKRVNGSIMMPLLAAPGAVKIVEVKDEKIITEAVEEYNSL